MFRRALHLSSFLPLLVALLYGGAHTRASEAPFAPSSDAGATQVSGDPIVSPHLALLLPTGSDAFASAAEAVRGGFVEAAKKQTGAALPVRLYSVTDDPQQVIVSYRKALAAGARMVIGPLTRRGVTALASSGNLITVPTLALNAPERITVYPRNFFTLSLQVDAEARQVAQLVLNGNRRKALTVTEPTMLGRRMRDAFIEEFQRAGGYHIADYPYAADNASLERIKQASELGVADVIFLALDAQRARAIRPFVQALDAYGTSQINPGVTATSSGPDINDMRFIDMPWMVQPEHPAVMVYAQAGPREPDDMERLRALGIDAYRVAQDLLAGKRDIDIDGVTGHLTLGPGGQIRRALLITLISGGRVTVLGETRP